MAMSSAVPYVIRWARKCTGSASAVSGGSNQMTRAATPRRSGVRGRLFRVILASAKRAKRGERLQVNRPDRASEFGAHAAGQRPQRRILMIPDGLERDEGTELAPVYQVCRR